MTPSEALRGAEALGPYFMWEQWQEDRGWRPLSELLDAGVVAERVEVARQALVRRSGLSAEQIGAREVASITFLGWASRLVSPLLGAVAISGVLPRAEIGHLWWRPGPESPLPIACSEATEGDFDLDVVGALLEVVSERFALPEHLLWGNVASALGGAAGMIADSAPEHAAEAAAIVERLLRRAPLKDTAVLAQPDRTRARWFLVRRNCCLYYRIPGAGKCGDCVLTPEALRRQHWDGVLRSRRRS
ncbi:(2Fe-2S)-binding protein [Paractinoplanes rhizophilus]|uniref:(2Fe-2S)-binding protein n=1 Tax=Paractinoplanes rhizophilus TaxID=1416877 RepID=A0ABW2I2L5_9ACTN